MTFFPNKIRKFFPGFNGTLSNPIPIPQTKTNKYHSFFVPPSRFSWLSVNNLIHKNSTLNCIGVYWCLHKAVLRTGLWNCFHFVMFVLLCLYHWLCSFLLTVYATLSLLAFWLPLLNKLELSYSVSKRLKVRHWCEPLRGIEGLGFTTACV